MSLLSRRRIVWAVPAAVAGAVVTAGLLPGLASGGGGGNLPDRTAAELLVAVQRSDVQQFSGTIVETARLGLPDLPGGDRAATLNWQSLITGSHTFQVWADGPQHQRLALLGQLAESDVVHDGTDLWTYTSSTQEVTHATLPAERAQQAQPASTEAPLTPQEAATQALKAIDPSTEVSVDGTQVVAGRSAYTLSLTPRDTRSTVRNVLIALDGETSMPLRVQVFGKGVDAAFETGFTDLTLSRPSASIFRFTPPAGATVKENDLTGGPSSAPADPSHPDAVTSAPTVLGTGWTSILRLQQPAPQAGAAPASSSVLDRLTTLLPNGDRLLSTSLVNALMTTDGRVFVGAVTPDLLEKAAAGAAG